jgi:hypothetical protein
MSIYRKFAREAPNDVLVNAVAQKAPTPSATGAAQEDAEQSKRRKGAPMDTPLPRTFTWVTRLPQDVQPIGLMRLYPRIANLLASGWDDRDGTYQYFDELLNDRRGHRKGFPPDVMGELLALRTYFAGIHPTTSANWEDLTKR